MPQTPAPTRANVRQSATWRISDTNLSPPCQLTTHAADSMLFLSKSRLFGFLPTKFPEYPPLFNARTLPARRPLRTRTSPGERRLATRPETYSPAPPFGNRKESPSRLGAHSSGDLRRFNRRASESSSNRSKERRVGKECRSRWSPYHPK